MTDTTDSPQLADSTCRLQRDEVLSVVKEILSILQSSNLVNPNTADRVMRFWTQYKLAADEYDTEFLEKYRDDMDGSMIFAGLFSAVTATIASMTLADLAPDPNEKTQALLENIWLSLNHTTDLAPPAVAIPVWDGPPTSVIWVQSLLYASLACSLFAALGAVLGKQWLRRFSSTGQRGSMEDRCNDRQRKFDGLQDWHFRRVLEVLPVLLQLSLLLFGLALSALMWSHSRIVAIVLVVANALGACFYFSTIVVSLFFIDSPFHTPLSDFIQSACAHLGRVFKNTSVEWEGSLLQKRCKEAAIAFHSVLSLFSNIISLMMGSARRRARSLGPSQSSASLQFEEGLPEEPNYVASDTEAHPMPHPQDELDELRHGTLSLPAPTSPITQLRSGFTSVLDFVWRSRSERGPSNGAALLWLLQTTTDAVVCADALEAAPFVTWPSHLYKDLCTGDRLNSLLERLALCFAKNDMGRLGLPPSNIPRAVNVCAALLFMYWEFRVVNGEKARRWVLEFGAAYVAEHAEVLTHALFRHQPSLDMPKHTYDTNTILYLTFVTMIRHWTNDMNTAPIVGYSSSTMSLDSLRARTLLYLAQDSVDTGRTNSLLNIPLPEDPLVTPEDTVLAFVAYAIICGYRSESFDSSRLTSAQLLIPSAESAVCILDQMADLLSWQLQWPGANEQILVQRFRVHRENPIVAMNVQRSLSHRLCYCGTRLESIRTAAISNKILNVCSMLHSLHPDNKDIAYLRRATFVDLLALSVHVAFPSKRDILPRMHQSAAHPWIPPSNMHVTWISFFLEDLRTHFPDLRIPEYRVWIALSHAFRMLAFMDTPIGDNPNLVACLQWIMQAPIPSGRKYGPIERALVQAHSAALYLWYHRRNEWISASCTFSPISYVKSLIRPETSLSNSMSNDLDILARDALFTSIVCSFYISTDKAKWFNDEANDMFIRSWVHIIHRWIISRPTGHNDYRGLTLLAPMDLLSCERIRRPTPEVWGADFARVQRVAVVAAWSEWSYWVFKRTAPENPELLVVHTVEVLAIDPEIALPVERFIHFLRNYLHSNLPRVHAVVRDLRQAYDTLSNKLNEIKEFKKARAAPQHAQSNREAVPAQDLSSRHSPPPWPSIADLRPLMKLPENSRLVSDDGT
ncbi:hypothetical protein EIP91_005203 [Steccherinum ochraceum]|uniref:DUF6535 domain-containing protein n=1 Tax=Steccherinum ochraceum TaxID=92696 RepID=A0A4R0RDK6_9APHY|nr:hypothetical protein EIP91_005203 [Steccherinum ochraceum]